MVGTDRRGGAAEVQQRTQLDDTRRLMSSTVSLLRTRPAIDSGRQGEGNSCASSLPAIPPPLEILALCAGHAWVNSVVRSGARTMMPSICRNLLSLLGDPEATTDGTDRPRAHFP
jgi:hypothetical protein